MNTLKLLIVRTSPRSLQRLQHLHTRNHQVILTSPLVHNSISTANTLAACNNKSSQLLTNTQVSSTQRRYCSDDGKRGPPAIKLPALMQFPEIVWPSLIKSVRNFILATFIVRPYFDRDFNLPDFVGGAKHALEVVSSKLSQGDTKALEGLVQGDVIPKLSSSVSLMSMMQRELLAINKEDIYFSFPYQIGIMFNDEEGANQKRFVEITMVFHTLRGLAQMRERGEEPPINMGMLPEYQKRISICNYRFIREYTKGVEGEWTINLLNHFRPTDSFPENE